MAIPDGASESLRLYRDHRVHPGGFLEAVLSNNLFSAVARADKTNRACLADIILYICHEFPEEIYGSAEKFRRYLYRQEES